MRPKFTNIKLEDLRRERDDWRRRAEERQRFQDEEEEAWEFFNGQAALRSKTREAFEQEFKRNVHVSGLYRGSQEEQEKQLQEWTEEVQKLAQREERKVDAEERQNMEHEDAHTRSREAWDRRWEQRVFFTLVPAPANWAWTSVETACPSHQVRSSLCCWRHWKINDV